MLPTFPFLLALYEVVIYLSNDMYLPALPQVSANLHITHHLAQLTIATCFIGTAFAQLILGPISDHYGRRPVLLLGGIVFILSTVICALTSNIYILLVARFFQGCSVGSLMVSGYAAIHESYEQKKAMQILALMGSITILAPALGPVAGGLLLNFITWRGIFWVLTFWASIVLLALMKWMPETLPIKNRQNLEFQSTLSTYSKILHNKKFVLAMLSFCPLFAAMVVWISSGPFLITSSFHQSPLYFGILQLIIFTGFIIGTQTVKQLIKKINPHQLICCGLLLALAFSLLSLYSSQQYPKHLILFILCLTGFTFGTAFCFPLLQRIAIESSEQPIGCKMAIFSSLLGCFMGLGSLLASLTYHGTSFNIAIMITILTVVATLANFKK